MTLEMVTTPLSKYQIAETKSFEKIKKKIDKKLYSKIENFVYPQLKENPFYGSNIKKLKDNLGVCRIENQISRHINQISSNNHQYRLKVDYRSS